MSIFITSFNCEIYISFSHSPFLKSSFFLFDQNTYIDKYAALSYWPCCSRNIAIIDNIMISHIRERERENYQSALDRI